MQITRTNFNMKMKFCIDSNKTPTPKTNSKKFHICKNYEKKNIKESFFFLREFIKESKSIFKPWI